MLVPRPLSRLCLAAGLAGLVAVVACQGDGKAGAKAPADTPDTLAIVGDDWALDRARLDAIVAELPPAMRAEYARRGNNELVADLVDRALLVAEAKSRGLEAEPALAARLDLARASVLAEAVVPRLLREAIPEEEAKAWYDANRDTEMASPPSDVVRQISVTPRRDKEVVNLERDDAGDEEEAKRKIQMIAKRAASGEDFSELARRFGEDRSASEGGLLPPFPAGSLPKAFAEQMEKLSPGQVSGVLRSDYGYHILQLVERRPAKTPTWEESKNAVRDKILEKDASRRANLLAESLKKLREKYPVTLHPERISPAGGSAAVPASGASAQK